MKLNIYRVTIASCLIGLSILLSACISKGNISLSPDLQPLEGEARGWLVASVGVQYAKGELAPFQSNRILFQAEYSESKGGGGSLRLYIPDLSRMSTQGLDVSSDGLFLESQAVALRPGRYRLYGAHLSSDGGTVAQYVSYTDADYIFEVEEDKITYLGSFIARTLTGKNLFGMKVRSGAYFLVENQEARDISLVLKKEQELSGLEVINVVPRFSPDKESFFLSR